MQTFEVQTNFIVDLSTTDCSAAPKKVWQGQSKLYKSTDSISLLSISLHFGLMGPFLPMQTLEVLTDFTIDSTAAGYHCENLKRWVGTVHTL
jgi:hypothetical protein